MARARSIKPGFFKSEQLAECSPWARLLFAGLWTLADREGRLEYRPLRIKAELFPYDAVNVHDLAVELHGQKLLVIYEAEMSTEIDHESTEMPKFISIPNFGRHQRPHPKEPDSVIPQPPCLATRYVKAVEKHGEPCKETAGCAFPSSNPLILRSSNPITPKRSAARTGRKAKPRSPDFDAWYATYPKRVAPQDALKAYERTVGVVMDSRGLPRSEAVSLLLEAAAAFAASDKGRGEFCPHPATWLNQGRYDDDRATWINAPAAIARSRREEAMDFTLGNS